jgi:hypothetical protein
MMLLPDGDVARTDEAPTAAAAMSLKNCILLMLGGLSGRCMRLRSDVVVFKRMWVAVRADGEFVL